MPPKDPYHEAENDKPKLWKWNDEYKYPLPKPTDDHWKIILEPLLMQDNSQCDAWKDEVQNLLIFAGLFSAVVTGFVIESYKSLSPDPNDAIIAILFRVATSIAILTNGTSMAVPQDRQEPTEFSPAQYVVRINILWFSSLILSLVTVVVGTVSLQWLREHQRYMKPLNSRQALAIFHLRSESLKKWHVRRLFTFLPLLLQGAVVLFFVGLLEFLWTLNNAVAGVAIVLIGLTLLFLTVTTALPTIQLLTATSSSASAKCIPTQCPYKSPQAWVFRHTFLAFISMATLLNHYLQQVCPRLHNRAFLNRLDNIVVWTGRKFSAIFSMSATKLPLNLTTEYLRHDWIDFDTSWLTLRPKHYLVQKGKSIGHNTCPIYDLVQALAFLSQGHSPQEGFAFATYYAYKELCESLIRNSDKALNGAESVDDNTAALKFASQLEILQSPFSPLRSAFFQQDGASMRAVRDEMLFLFMNLPGIKEYSSLPDHPAGLHRLELFTRMLVCKFFYRCNSPPSHKLHVNPIHHFLTVDKSYPERIWEIPESFIVGMMTQHYRILEHIFEQASTLLPRNPQAIITIVGYPELENFFEHVAWIPIPEPLENNFSNILEVIRNGLALYPGSHVHDRADLLFFCARLYLEKVARHRWFLDLMKFNQYKQVHKDIVYALRVMVDYEKYLDKVTYIRLENLWRAELYPNNHTITRVPRPAPTVASQVYHAIPEVLRRFLPYEQLPSPTVHRHSLESGFHLDYGSTEEQGTSEGYNSNMVGSYLAGGEAITFFVPEGNSSFESK